MTCEQLTLHIGAPKTGTTTIQAFLTVNHQRLQSHGILTVRPGSLRSYPTDRTFWDEGRLRGGLQEMQQQMKAGRVSRILWSHEWLSAFLSIDAKFPERIRRELPAAQYRVVIYLRRQDYRLASGYLQAAIKCKEYPGGVFEFSHWLRHVAGDRFQKLLQANADYAGLLQPWIDVFGHENVVIRVFEKGQLLDGNLLQDFCDAAELPATDCDFKIPNQNVSFNMELHDMLGMYNSVFAEATYSVKMNRFLELQAQDDFFSGKFFSRFKIPPNCRIEILQRCEESNRKVARELLGREDGVLFREPWPRPDEPYQPYAGLTTDKLVPILLHLLQKQDERIRKLERLTRQLSVTGVVRSISRKVKRRITSLVTLGKRPAESLKGDRPVFADMKTATAAGKEATPK